MNNKETNTLIDDLSSYLVEKLDRTNISTVEIKGMVLDILQFILKPQKVNLTIRPVPVNIKSKWDAICNKCGKEINVNESCWLMPDMKGATCVSCKKDNENELFGKE